MSFQGEEVHHVGQLGGDLDEGHGGRRQDDVVHLLGLELGGEDRVLIPPLDSTPDVTGAQGEEVTAENLADRELKLSYLLIFLILL